MRRSRLQIPIINIPIDDFGSQSRFTFIGFHTQTVTDPLLLGRLKDLEAETGSIFVLSETRDHAFRPER
jgi:hypothetical protein